MQMSSSHGSGLVEVSVGFAADEVPVSVLVLVSDGVSLEVILEVFVGEAVLVGVLQCSQASVSSSKFFACPDVSV